MIPHSVALIPIEFYLQNESAAQEKNENR
jgi:hypothetical protein